MKETEAKLNRNPRRVTGDLEVTGAVEFERETNDLSLDAADQATAPATLTVPDLGGNDGEVVVDNLPQTLSEKTLADPAITGSATLGDNVKHVYGSGGDAEVYYDGADMYINPRAVGSGRFRVLSNVTVDDDETIRKGLLPFGSRG